MTQINKVGKVSTCIYGDNGYINVRYHSTIVTKFNDSEIILNSGGWLTYTTKSRMNQVSNQFDLGYQVYQDDFTWYVVINRDWNNPVVFYDGIKFIRKNGYLLYVKS